MKAVALLLSLLLAGSEAGKLATLMGLSDKDLVQFVRPPVHADINYYVDRSIPTVLAFMRENELDPMPLPDTTEGFYVRPLLVTYGALLHLTNGWLYNLASVRRSGDATVMYFAQLLRIRIEIDFRNLEFAFDYDVRVMYMGPTGGVEGTLNRLNAELDLLIDFNNDEIHIQDFIISDVGTINVQLTGNRLIDWLYTPVVNVITTLFRSSIVNIIERNIRDEIQGQVDIINANLRDL